MFRVPFWSSLAQISFVDQCVWVHGFWGLEPKVARMATGKVGGGTEIVIMYPIDY